MRLIRFDGSPPLIAQDGMWRGEQGVGLDPSRQWREENPPEEAVPGDAGSRCLTHAVPITGSNENSRQLLTSLTEVSRLAELEARTGKSQRRRFEMTTGDGAQVLWYSVRASESAAALVGPTAAAALIPPRTNSTQPLPTKLQSSADNGQRNSRLLGNGALLSHHSKRSSDHGGAEYRLQSVWRRYENPLLATVYSQLFSFSHPFYFPPKSHSFVFSDTKENKNKRRAPSCDVTSYEGKVKGKIYIKITNIWKIKKGIKITLFYPPPPFFFWKRRNSVPTSDVINLVTNHFLNKEKNVSKHKKRPNRTRG